MKKILKKLIGKSINIFNHIKKILERILKITLQSAVLCCPVILMLIITNSILGTNISFSYYLTLAKLVILATTIIICALKWKQIIAKPVKSSKKTAPSKTDRKIQRADYRKKKRIS